MKSKQTGRTGLLPLTALVSFWAVTLVIGWQWARPMVASAWTALPLALDLALLTALTLAWVASRARATRRLLAVLEVYADREIRRSRVLLPRTADHPAVAD